jgi:two-component system, chemotaxis family, response regulator Rcp1
MLNAGKQKLIEILLVEDNPGDVRLTIEALKEGNVSNHISVVGDGRHAMEFLLNKGEYADAPRPDLILLDLNLPGMDGRDVLSEIKKDDKLKCIPVIILTTSKDEQDIMKTYKLHANCYITKPVLLDDSMKMVKLIEEFWLSLVKLPKDLCGR